MNFKIRHLVAKLFLQKFRTICCGCGFIVRDWETFTTKFSDHDILNHEDVELYGIAVVRLIYIACG